MPTCLDIITRAHQKAKITSSGEEPSAEEANDGLLELQSLYEQWASSGMFGRISDYDAEGADYEAEENQRIVTTDGTLVTLPTTITTDDEERPPYDTAFVEIVDTVAQTVERHIYSNGAWVEITGLALADEAPLANKGHAGLSACLAMILADEFGGEIGPSVMRQCASFKTGLSLKLGGDARRSASDYF